MSGLADADGTSDPCRCPKGSPCPCLCAWPLSYAHVHAHLRAPLACMPCEPLPVLLPWYQQFKTSSLADPSRQKEEQELIYEMNHMALRARGKQWVADPPIPLPLFKPLPPPRGGANPWDLDADYLGGGGSWEGRWGVREGRFEGGGGAGGAMGGSGRGDLRGGREGRWGGRGGGGFTCPQGQALVNHRLPYPPLALPQKLRPRTPPPGGCPHSGLSVAGTQDVFGCWRSPRRADGTLQGPRMQGHFRWVMSRHATSVWQGNWLSVAAGPVSRATQ